MMQQFVEILTIFLLTQTKLYTYGKSNEVKLEHSVPYDQQDVFGIRDDVPKTVDNYQRLQLNDASHEERHSPKLNENSKVLASYIPGLTQQIFKDINDGNHDLTRADIPVHPDEQYVIPDVNLQNPEDGTSSVERIFGYFKPPEDGSYIFLLSSHGESTFSMSTSSDSSSLQKYADVLPGQSVTKKQYDKFQNQKSEPVQMFAGHMYYLEVIHKRIDGPSHVQLGAIFPDGTKHFPVASKFFFSVKEGKDETKSTINPIKETYQPIVLKYEESTRDADVRQLDKLDNKLEPIKCGPKVRLYSTNYKCIKRDGHVCKYGISADDSILKLNTRDSTTLFSLVKPGLNNFADSVSFQLSEKHGFYLLKDGEKFIVAPNDGSKEFALLSSFAIENGDHFLPSSYHIKMFHTQDDYICHSPGSGDILKDKRSENCVFYIVPDELDMNAFEPTCKDICEAISDSYKDNAPNLEALPNVLNDLAHHNDDDSKSNLNHQNPPDVMEALAEHAVNVETHGYGKQTETTLHNLDEEEDSRDVVKTRLNVERVSPSSLLHKKYLPNESIEDSSIKARLLARISSEKNGESNLNEDRPLNSLGSSIFHTSTPSHSIQETGTELKEKLLDRIKAANSEKINSPLETYPASIDTAGLQNLLEMAKETTTPSAVNVEITGSELKQKLLDRIKLHNKQAEEKLPSSSGQSILDRLGISSSGSEPSNTMMPLAATQIGQPLKEKLLSKLKAEQEASSSVETTPFQSLFDGPSKNFTERLSESHRGTYASSSNSEKESEKEKTVSSQPLNLDELTKGESSEKSEKSSNQQFITIHFQNEVGTSGDVRIISSIKPEGYLLGSDIFKLKLVFKYKYVKSVRFFGKDESGKTRKILLNGKESVVLTPIDNQKDYQTIVVTATLRPDEPTHQNENTQNTENTQNAENTENDVSSTKITSSSTKVISGVARNKFPEAVIQNKEDLILDNQGPMEHVHLMHYRLPLSEESVNDIPDVVEIAYDDDNAQKKTITEIHVGKGFLEHENKTVLEQGLIKNVTTDSRTTKLNEIKSNFNSSISKPITLNLNRNNSQNQSFPSKENNGLQIHGERLGNRLQNFTALLNASVTTKRPLKVEGKRTKADSMDLFSNKASAMDNPNTNNDPESKNAIKNNTEDDQDQKLFEKLSKTTINHRKANTKEPVSLEKIQAEINKLDEASAALQSSGLPKYHDTKFQEDYSSGKLQKKTFGQTHSSSVVNDGDVAVVEKKNLMSTLHALEENSYIAKQKSLNNFLHEYTNEDEVQKQKYRAWVARHRQNELFNAVPVTGVRRSPIRSRFFTPFSPTDPVVIHEDIFNTGLKRFDMLQNLHRPIQFHDDKRTEIPRHRHLHKRVRRNTCQCDEICTREEDTDGCMFDCENMCDVAENVGKKKHKVRTKRSLAEVAGKVELAESRVSRRSLPYAYTYGYQKSFPESVASPNNVKANPYYRSVISQRYYWKMVYPTEPLYQYYKRWLQPTQWYRPFSNDHMMRYYINKKPTTSARYNIPQYKKLAPLFYTRNKVPGSSENIKKKVIQATKKEIPLQKSRTHRNRIIAPVKVIQDEGAPVKKTVKNEESNQSISLHKFSKTVTGNRRTLTPLKQNVYSWHPLSLTRYAKIFEHSMPVVFKRNMTMNAPLNSKEAFREHKEKDKAESSKKILPVASKNVTFYKGNSVENKTNNIDDKPNHSKKKLNDTTIEESGSLKEKSSNHSDDVTKAKQKLNKYKAALLAMMTKSGITLHTNRHVEPSFEQRDLEHNTQSKTENTSRKDQLAELQETFDQLNPDVTTNNVGLKSNTTTSVENKSRIVNKIMNEGYHNGKRNNSYFAIEIAEDEGELKEKENEKNAVTRMKTSGLEQAKQEIENEEENEKEKERERSREPANNILFDNDVSSIFYSSVQNNHRRVKNGTSILLKENEDNQSPSGKGFVNHTASTGSSAYPVVKNNQKNEKEKEKHATNIVPTKPLLIKSSQKQNKTSKEQSEGQEILNEGDSIKEKSRSSTVEVKPTIAPTLQSLVQKPSDDHDLPTGKHIEKSTPKNRQINRTTPSENQHHGQQHNSSNSSKKLNKDKPKESFRNKTLNETKSTYKPVEKDIKVEKLNTPKEIEAVYTDRMDADGIYPKIDQTSYEEQLYKPYANHDTVNGDWFDTGFHPDSRTKQDIKMSKSGFLNKLMIRQKLRLEREKMQKVHPTTKILEDKIKNIVKAAEIRENGELQNLITDSIGTALNDEQQSNALNIKNAFHNISDLAQQDVEADNSLIKPVKGDNSEIAKIMSDYNDELSLQEKESPPQLNNGAETKDDVMHQMDIHDQQEINALKSDLAGSISEKVKSQMMANFTDDPVGFEEYAEKKRFHTIHNPNYQKRKFFMNADITSLSKTNDNVLPSNQVSDAITESGNPFFPTAKEQNDRKHKLAKGKENKEFEKIKEKWKKVKEQNKHIAKDQNDKLKEEEGSAGDEGETRDLLNSYFTEVESKRKFSPNGKDTTERQEKRQKKIKETLAMINDIEHQIDGMIHSSEHGAGPPGGRHSILKAKKKGKTAIYNELVGSSDHDDGSAINEVKKKLSRTEKARKVNSNYKHASDETLPEREELEDNDDNSETKNRPKPTEDYIENAQEEEDQASADMVEDQPPKKIRHHRRKHLRHHAQSTQSRDEDDGSIANVIATSDQKVRQQQASELLNFQQQEVNDDLLKLKEVTQDGLRSMFAKAVAKQQKFMDEVQGTNDDESNDDVIARDQLRSTDNEKLESYLGDQTLPYSNDQSSLRDISPNEIGTAPSQELGDEELPSNRKSDVEHEEFDEETLDNDIDPQDENDIPDDDYEEERRRRTIW